MKTHGILRSFPRHIVIFALAGATLAAGCQSSAARRSPALNQGAETSSAIDDSVERIEAARRQISRTTAALRNLVDRPGDTASQYEVAGAEIRKMTADSDAIAASVAAVRAQGDAYLAEWSRKIAAITNPELRDAAFVRRGEVAAQLQKIYQSYQEVQSAYAPFRTGIADIQTVLGADLSAKGLAAASPFVAKASADAYPLSASLGKLSADFSAVGKALRPGGE